jgi:hypothetical protein
MLVRLLVSEFSEEITILYEDEDTIVYAKKGTKKPPPRKPGQPPGGGVVETCWKCVADVKTGTFCCVPIDCGTVRA